MKTSRYWRMRWNHLSSEPVPASVRSPRPPNRECVDIQWFDPDFLYQITDPAIKNYLFDTETGTTEYTQWSAEAFMSGDVFDVPAGSVAVAVGLHYQEDEILDTPGPITLAGNAWGASSAGITAGQDTTRAVFGEVNVPLIADAPMIERLEFTGSARYTDVESYGSDTTYKVGLNWAITDSFRVRSTMGTSFRTPALYELYLASQTQFSAVGPRLRPVHQLGRQIIPGRYLPTHGRQLCGRRSLHRTTCLRFRRPLVYRWRARRTERPKTS
ncbi:MAG: TonB-dependent receptor [Woeseiaceae bacterium]|nr:TonB-dependent receptor [Woeseiaceae bacterium]